MRVNVSYGIICWYWNKKTRGWEVCLVQKRLTYAFSEFVAGNYNMKELIPFLNKLTVEERMIIRSLDFRIIWYHAHQYDPNETATRNAHKNNYNNCKKIFERNFIVHSNGKNLRNAIEATSHNNITRIWGIPKGHKIDNNESDLDAALREFREETHISLNSIRIVPKCTTYHSFIGDDEVRYKYTFYNALFVGERKMNPLMRDCIEIVGMTWVPIGKVSLIAPELDSILKRTHASISQRVRAPQVDVRNI